MTGPLTTATNESYTSFGTVTFDDTPAVAFTLHDTCIYFDFHNTSVKTVHIQVGGAGTIFELVADESVLLHGNPSRYTILNDTDAASITIVYAIHHYR